MSRKKRAYKSKNSNFFFNFLVVSFALIALVSLVFGYFKISGRTASCANSITCLGDLSGKYEKGKTSSFMGHLVNEPSLIAEGNSVKHVLGSNTSGEKHIFVDLSTQTLRAYSGNDLVFTFPVATGKWHPTPTGDFRIWIKIRYAHMEGGEGADYYNLYNVPYTMFFYNSEVPKSAGFSLHGAYWHNNFGHPMSHGCVNIRPEDAALLYDWASPTTGASTTYATEDDPGTLVTIYGTPPEE